MNQTPQWVNGHTGPLVSGRKLTVALRRTEGELWVNPEYSIDLAEATDVFNSFLGLRCKYRIQKHGRPGKLVAVQLPCSHNHQSLRP